MTQFIQFLAAQATLHLDDLKNSINSRNCLLNGSIDLCLLFCLNQCGGSRTFDVEPDPTFQADADPDVSARKRKIFLLNLHIFFQKSYQT